MKYVNNFQLDMLLANTTGVIANHIQNQNDVIVNLNETIYKLQGDVEMSSCDNEDELEELREKIMRYDNEIPTY